MALDRERRLVHGVFSHLGNPPNCTSDARPHGYLVAVARDALPPRPFVVRLSGEVACGGCAGTEEVAVDLGEP